MQNGIAFTLITCIFRKSEFFFVCQTDTLWRAQMQVGQDLSKYMRPPNLMGPTQIHQRSSQQLFFFYFFFFFHKSFSVLTLEKGGFESYNYSGHGKPLIISSSKFPHHLKLLLHLLFACMYILTSCENF